MRRTIRLLRVVAPFTGTFRPEGSLSDEDGFMAAGIWRLEVYDDTKFGTGTLNSWSITIAHEAAPWR